MKKFLSGIALWDCCAWRARPSRAQDKANGEKVYKAKCASCHGPDGKGETAAGKATKARDHLLRRSEEGIRRRVDGHHCEGQEQDAVYDKKITDAEVKDVIAYMRSLCK